MRIVYRVGVNGTAVGACNINGHDYVIVNCNSNFNVNAIANGNVNVSVTANTTAIDSVNVKVDLAVKSPRLLTSMLAVRYDF